MEQPIPQQGGMPRDIPEPAAPMGPMGPEESAQMMPGPEMDGQAPISDAQYAELQQLLGQLKQVQGQLTSAEFISGNKSKAERESAQKQVYYTLMQNGVDLNDPESVRGFLEQLKAESPEMYETVVQALEELFPDEQGELETEPQIEEISEEVAEEPESPVLDTQTTEINGQSRRNIQGTEGQ